MVSKRPLPFKPSIELFVIASSLFFVAAFTQLTNATHPQRLVAGLSAYSRWCFLSLRCLIYKVHAFHWRNIVSLSNPVPLVNTIFSFFPLFFRGPFGAGKQPRQNTKLHPSCQYLFYPFFAHYSLSYLHSLYQSVFSCQKRKQTVQTLPLYAIILNI